MRDSLLKPGSRAWLGRGLFVVVLALVVLAEAWYVVLLQQQLRGVSSEYAALLRQQRDEQTRWTRLVLEYGHLTAPVVLERRAREQLGMAYRPPTQTLTLFEDRTDEDQQAEQSAAP